MLPTRTTVATRGVGSTVYKVYVKDRTVPAASTTGSTASTRIINGIGPYRVGGSETTYNGVLAREPTTSATWPAATASDVVPVRASLGVPVTILTAVCTVIEPPVP